MTRTAAAMIAVVLALVATAPASARQESPVAPLAPADVLLTSDPAIAAALDRIAARSPLWREAVADVGLRGRRVLLLTPDQVVVADDGQSDPSSVDAFDATSLAEVSPVVRDGAAVDAVLVVVNVPLLAGLHESLGTGQGEFEADLERVLIHEVYGHAVPYLQAGDTSGRCADPGRGRDPLDACSVRRENAVREEAGLGLRRDYALGGLVVMERLARVSALSAGGGR